MIITSTDIVNKANTLFRNYGIKSITMDDLASAMGISKKTLYQSFENKEDLVKRAINYILLEMKKEIKALPDKPVNAIEQLIEIQKMIFRFMKNYSSPAEHDLKKYYPLIYRTMYDEYVAMLERIFIQNIQKGKSEGLYCEDLNEEIIAKMHTSRIVNLPQNNVISTEEYTSAEYMKEMLKYHLRALLNSKNISSLDKYLNELKQ